LRGAVFKVFVKMLVLVALPRAASRGGLAVRRA